MTDLNTFLGIGVGVLIVLAYVSLRWILSDYREEIEQDAVENRNEITDLHRQIARLDNEITTLRECVKKEIDADSSEAVEELLDTFHELKAGRR